MQDHQCYLTKNGLALQTKIDTSEYWIYIVIWISDIQIPPILHIFWYRRLHLNVHVLKIKIIFTQFSLQIETDYNAWLKQTHLTLKTLITLHQHVLHQTKMHFDTNISIKQLVW